MRNWNEVTKMCSVNLSMYGEDYVSLVSIPSDLRYSLGGKLPHTLPMLFAKCTLGLNSEMAEIFVTFLSLPLHCIQVNNAFSSGFPSQPHSTSWNYSVSFQHIPTQYIFIYKHHFHLFISSIQCPVSFLTQWEFNHFQKPLNFQFS